MKTQKEQAAGKSKTAEAASGAGKASKPAAGMNPQPNSVQAPDIKAEGLPASVKTGTKIEPVKPSEKDGKQPSKTNSSGTEGSDQVKNVKPSSMPKVHEVKVPAVSKAIEAMSDDELIAALEAQIAQADAEDGMMPEMPEGEGSKPVNVHIDLDSHKGEMEGAGPACKPGDMPAKAEDDASELPVLIDDEPGASSEGGAYANASLVKKLRATAQAMRDGVAVEDREVRALMRSAVAVLRDAGEPVAAMPVSAASDSAVLREMRRLSGTVARLTRQVQDLKRVKAADDQSAPPASPPADSAPPASPAPESAPPPPAPAPEASDEEKVEEIMQEAQGVNFEVLQSLDQLERSGITAQAIDMHLYAEGSVNPFWNVVVAGEPLARIYLQDQDRPEEIKALFCSSQYGEAIAKASEQIKGGLRQVLTEAKARLFAMQYDKSTVAKKAQETAQADAKKVVADKLATLSDRFVECMATAAIGMDRNFFKSGNPLKTAFFETLQARGMSDREAIRIIEDSVATGSADYFKALAGKANELMDMEPAAFDQLRKAILEAGVIMPLEDPEAVEAEVQDTGTLAQHLAEHSVAIQAGAGGDQYTLDPREQLKRDLGFRRG